MPSAVPNCRTEEKSPVPAEFFARTRQKYVVRPAKPETTALVSVSVESLKRTPVANVLLVATCRWYDVAPSALRQKNVTGQTRSVALSAGGCEHRRSEDSLLCRSN